MDVAATLSPAECLALLRPGGIGRVSLSIGALPAIFPVHYRVVDDDIVFRAPADHGSAPGTLDGTVIAFEADEFDPADDGGWSVLVVGRVESAAEPGFTRVPSERISGLRFDPPGNLHP